MQNVNFTPRTLGYSDLSSQMVDRCTRIPMRRHALHGASAQCSKKAVPTSFSPPYGLKREDAQLS